jgi:predicted RNA-binding protein with TRAM domain
MDGRETRATDIQMESDGAAQLEGVLIFIPGDRVWVVIKILIIGTIAQIQRTISERTDTEGPETFAHYRKMIFRLNRSQLP